MRLLWRLAVGSVRFSFTFLALKKTSKWRRVCLGCDSYALSVSKTVCRCSFSVSVLLSVPVCLSLCLSVCLSVSRSLSLSLSLFLSVDTQSSTWTNHSHMRTILYLGRKAFSCAFVKSEKHRKYLWTFTYCYYTYFIHQRRLIYELHLGRNRFAWPKRML